MPLYVIEVKDGDPGRLSWRAVQRLREAEAVVVEPGLESRFASLLSALPVAADAVALARTGKRVALLTSRPVPPGGVPWELLPAVTEPEQFQETRPLQGMGVVVTRPHEQAGPLLQRLEELGARAYGVPSIAIEPYREHPELDAALQQLASYQWLLFTSGNAVAPFMERLRAAGRDARALAGLRIACIGPATSAALLAYGLCADVLPESYVAEGLLESLGEVSGERFLLPRAEEAREVLPKTLRARGAAIDVIPVYRTVAAPGREILQGLLAAGLVDAVTFTASSTVRHFPLEVPDQVAVVCIGPVTATTARERGWKVAREADVFTAEGVVAALVELWKGSRSNAEARLKGDHA
ncbi:MAG: uroporphyrinogen-III synthase [Candidatus Xenobia bacterium]